MTDPATLNMLKERIRTLEWENTSLAANCKRLATTQNTLEEIVASATQKQLNVEMQSLELEQIFSSCADPIWVVRHDGIVVRANSAMFRFLGRSQDEVVGHPCHEILKFCTRHSTSCPLASAHQPQSFHEWDIERPTGNGDCEFYMVSTSSLITLDGSPGIVGQFRDITMRKRAEAALAQANVALSHMARVDGLTQIPNRRAFDEMLAREWGRLAREDSPLTLILCDIDYFKQYNDQYGHQAGDDCLRRVAQALASCAQRTADLVARYGGEEFVLLLPQTPLEGALMVAENVRRTVEQLALQHSRSAVKPIVTLSLGVATVIPAQHMEADILIEMADQALYQAKKTGRNKVVSGHASRDDVYLSL